jgi:hypothetical protein
MAIEAEAHHRELLISVAPGVSSPSVATIFENIAMPFGDSCSASVV